MGRRPISPPPLPTTVKIAFYCFRLHRNAIGGAEACVSALAATLARRGHEVTLVASDDEGIAQLDRWRVAWIGNSDPDAGDAKTFRAGGLGVEPIDLEFWNMGGGPASPPHPPARLAKKLQRATERRGDDALAAMARRAEAWYEAARGVWGDGPWLRVGPGWQLPEFTPAGAARWTTPRFALCASPVGKGRGAYVRLEGNAPRRGWLRSADGGFEARLPGGPFSILWPIRSGVALANCKAFRPGGEARTLGLYIHSAELLDGESGAPLARADLSSTFEHAELGAWPGEDIANHLSRDPMPARLGSLFDRARGPNCAGAKSTVRQMARDCDAVVFAGLPFATVGWSRWAMGGKAKTAILPFLHAEDPYYAWQHYVDAMAAADAALLLTDAEGRALPPSVAKRRIGAANIADAGAIDLAQPFPSDADRRAARLRLGVPTEGPILAMLGRKTPGKGWRLVERAIPLLRDLGFPNARLLLAGPDEDQAPVDVATTSYLGKIDDDAKRDLMLAADLFAFFSQSESFGIALLEAWAGGCPALVGDRCGAVAEVGRSLGAATCASTPEAIAEAAAAWLRLPPTEREAIWRNGLAALQREFTWSVVADGFEAWLAEPKRPASKR
jgi:glycosyltransferase involved in cell wall biosynthesis